MPPDKTDGTRYMDGYAKLWAVTIVVHIVCCYYLAIGKSFFFMPLFFNFLLGGSFMFLSGSKRAQEQERENQRLERLAQEQAKDNREYDEWKRLGGGRPEPGFSEEKKQRWKMFQQWSEDEKIAQRCTERMEERK